MKMFILPLLALTLASTAAPDPVHTPASSPLQAAPECPEPEPYLAQGAPLRLQRLGELPPARAELAVVYREDGCPIPVIVKQRVGG